MPVPQPQPEVPPAGMEGRAPLESAAFETPADRTRLWQKETAARARAIALGMRGLQKVDDPDLKKRISAEFDTQLRGLVHHVLKGLLEQDKSGALAAAMENARAALGQEPEEMPFMDDLARITRSHIEELMADGELDDADLGVLTGTLEALLRPQLDQLAAVDQQKMPPGAGAEDDRVAPPAAAA